MHLIDFLKNELNYTCEICNTEKYEKEITSEVFNYCFDCAKVVCPNCTKSHKKQHKYIVPIYEKNLKNKHNPQVLLSKTIVSNQLETVGNGAVNESYNNDDNNINNDNYDNDIINQNKADDKNIIDEKNLYDFKPSENDLEIIKNKNIELRNRIKSLRVLIKMNNILLNTYEKHPDNYHNNKNISNVANSIINNGGNKNEIDEKDSDIRLKKIERILLDIINSNLKTNITGNETQLDLNNKSIGEIEFKLLSCVTFNNLEELYLQNNKLNKIDSLSIFNAPKLKLLIK